MKSYLLLPLAFLFSCSSVKKSENPRTTDQLLKDVEILSSDAYQGRKTGTKGAEMARTYIAKRFNEIGLKSFPSLGGFGQPFHFKNDKGVRIAGKNVIAFIPGKTDDVIVITAHYDHLGIIDGKVFNGADDNASGVAGLLKIAAFYIKNRPYHTLIFAAFDAEESERKGSAYFVNHPPVMLKKIKLNLNLDMISHNDKGELYACGTFEHPELKPFIITSIPDIKILFGHDNPKLGIDDWTNQSDQSAFNAKGIPFIYFGVEDHKDYHKETDEFKNINQPFFINASNAILEIVNNFDKQRDVREIFREKVRMKK